MTDSAQKGSPDDLLLGRAMMAEDDAEIGWARVKECCRRVIGLRAAGQDALVAMIAFRDGGDRECFQDAIDALGMELGRGKD